MAKRKNLAVVGTRPQLLKVSREWADVVVDTGQHWDAEMTQGFKPDYNLKTTELWQMIKKLDAVIEQEHPTVITVVGDTRSTYAGAVVALYKGLPLIHVESGMRSYENMAEERIRHMVDHVATHRLCADQHSVDNLSAEGLDGVLVGDVEFDRLFEYMPFGEKQADDTYQFKPQWKNKYPVPYCLLTLHRAELIEDRDKLKAVITAISKTDKKFIFPLHPHTRKKLKEFGIAIPKNIEVIKPLPHKELIRLILHAEKVVTDSGGVQREAAWLMRPVIIVRHKTEHTWIPVEGRGYLTGYSPDQIVWAVNNLQINHLAPDQTGNAHQLIANFINAI